MAEKVIIIIISLLAGVLITKILTCMEIHSLKEQLFESEKDNEAIIKDNADLVRQNDILRRKLWEKDKQNQTISKDNIPRFGD